MINLTHSITLLLKVIDFLLILVCGISAYFIRFDNTHIPDNLFYLTIIGAGLFVLFASSNNVYTSWRGHYGFKLTKSILLSVFITIGVLTSLLIFFKEGGSLSRLWFIFWWSNSVIIIFLFRASIYYAAAKLRSMGINSKSVLIIGDNELATRIIHNLNRSTWTGYTVAIVISYKDAQDKEKLIDISKETDEIWIALPISRGQDIRALMVMLQDFTNDIRLIPEINDLRLLNHQVSNIANLQTIDLSVTPIKGGSALLKRAMDIVFSLIIITFIFPLLAIISLSIRLTSPGPVIFRQKRNGIHGKSISVYKFRSMKIDSDNGASLKQAVKGDPRITVLGSFLRKSSLDELPQFFNVLQGRMSIVGPRPHATAHNEYYKDLVESYMRRHKVKPGITGWAQINGFRGETDTINKMEKRVEFDLYYIDNWSAWFDIKIISLTIFKGFYNKNAY